MKTRHYRLQVWDNEGEIAQAFWDCDERTYLKVLNEYDGRSNYEIVVQAEWETDDDIQPFESTLP